MVNCAANREVSGLNFDVFPAFHVFRGRPRPCLYAYRSNTMNADLLHAFRNLSIAVVSSDDAPVICAVEKLILKRL